MPAFAQDFDLILIDTQDARSIVLQIALLGSQVATSPITPDMLTAREFQRGMLQLYQDLEPLAALGAMTPMLNIFAVGAYDPGTGKTVIGASSGAIVANRLHPDTVKIFKISRV